MKINSRFLTIGLFFTFCISFSGIQNSLWANAGVLDTSGGRKSILKTPKNLLNRTTRNPTRTAKPRFGISDQLQVHEYDPHSPSRDKSNHPTRAQTKLEPSSRQMKSPTHDQFVKQMEHQGDINAATNQYLRNRENNEEPNYKKSHGVRTRINTYINRGKERNPAQFN